MIRVIQWSDQSSTQASVSSYHMTDELLALRDIILITVLFHLMPRRQNLGVLQMQRIGWK